MKENFKVGERVRLLHAKGEGIVTKLLGPSKLEVLIDDFYEMEVNVGEVVKINAAEQVLRREPTEETSAPKAKSTGPSLAPPPNVVPSFVLHKNADLDYEFWIVNPGRNEVLFAMYTRVGNKFICYNSGLVEPRNNHFLGKQTPAEFHQVRSLYLQTILFPKIEHPKPIPPVTLDINTKTDIFIREPRTIPELNVEGWEFVLEEKLMAPEPAEDTEVRVVAQKPPKPPKVVDLHLDKLVSSTLGIDSHTGLRIQVEAFEQAITNGHLHQLDSMVFIHGIGNGTLKREIHQRLKNYAFVREFQLAEPVLYGNGATIVYLD